MTEKTKTSVFVIGILFVHFLGFNWGLPSIERGELVVGDLASVPEELFESIKKGRERLYEIRAGAAPTAEEIKNGLEQNFGLHLGTMKGQIYSVEGNIFPRATLTAIGSYLLRSRMDDEAAIFAGLSGLRPRQGKFFSFGMHYGALYLFPMAALWGAAHVVGAVTLVNDIAHYYRHPEQMGLMFALGRFFSAAVSLFIFPAIYLVCRRVFDRRTAWIVMLLWVTTSIHIYISHVMKPHVYSAALALFSFYYALLIYDEADDQTAFYWKAGLFGGMAVGVAPNVVPLAAAPALCWLLRYRSQIFSKGPLKKIGLYFLSAAAATILLGHPWIFTDASELIRSLTTTTGARPNREFIPWIMHWWEAVSTSIGWWNIALAFGGFALLMLQKNRVRRLVGLYWIFYWVLVNWFLLGINEVHEVRFFVPVMVLMIVSTGFCLASTHRWVATVYLLFCFMMGGGQALNYYWENGKSAPTLQAGQWINQNIKSASSIGTSDFPIPDQAPPFKFQDYKIYVGLLEDFPNNPPDYFLVYRDRASFSSSPLIPAKDVAAFNSQYELAHAFQPALLNQRIFLNPFTQANHPYWIFVKKDT